MCRTVPVVVLVALTIGALASPVSARKPVGLAKPIQLTMQCATDANGDISVQFLSFGGNQIGSPVLIDCGRDSVPRNQKQTVNVKVPEQPDFYTWAGAYSDASGLGGCFAGQVALGVPTQCVDSTNTVAFTVNTA